MFSIKNNKNNKGVIKMNIENFNFLKENYKGIIEIYPTKCTSTKVLNKVLVDLSKTHNLVRITKDWIRAFEK